jgi:hypothetical protein
LKFKEFERKDNKITHPSAHIRHKIGEYNIDNELMIANIGRKRVKGRMANHKINTHHGSNPDKHQDSQMINHD